ncbi:death domain-containing protein 1 [Chanos chanos]|uniref:Death domain-containing protein 1 n=1 Tax=Chanos chanos TaxID=29144 RepID=A0A6J2VUW0_CHACN|nr:death domain-containing protein 1 [Chanos chanos]
MSNKIEETDLLHTEPSSEDSLLKLLQDSAQSLRGLLSDQGRTRGGRGLRGELTQAGVLQLGQANSAGTLCMLLSVLKELAELNTQRVRAWRETLRDTAHTLSEDCDFDPSLSGVTSVSDDCKLHHTTVLILSILQDTQNLEEKLQTIKHKLNMGMQSHFQTMSDDSGGHLDSAWIPKPLRGQTAPPNHCVRSPLPRTTAYADCTPEPLRMQTAAGSDVAGNRVIVMDQSESSESDGPAACYVTAPAEIAEVMTCEVSSDLSSVLVWGSEEMVSSIITIQVPDDAKSPFPITVAMSFRARYHGNHRDIAVKVVDRESRTSYVTPVSMESSYRGRRGSFAVIRVYTLGVFAVVSCLRRETFMVPKRGLSLKLSVDSRICLEYPPNTFPTPVIAQATVQPLDAAILSSLKSQRDLYHSALATSPLLYLSHPSPLTLRRPLTITMPCPPNPDKRRGGEEVDMPRPATAVQTRDTHVPCQLRIVSASVKSSRDTANEQLALLCWREEQWNILDKVNVKNLQNGLVSFELMEKYERLMVVRLLSPVKPLYLASLAEEVERAVRVSAVTIVLQRKKDDPYSVVVAALPSRDLSWEMAKLQAQAFCSPLEHSGDIPMHEGEQLLLTFSGNITCTDGHRETSKILTFHNQRRRHLHLTLTEVDSFGNYSSAHYKGTAVFTRVSVGQLVWKGNRPVPMKGRPLEEPVCKLSLTLPKVHQSHLQPSDTNYTYTRLLDALSDDLLSWLCEELAEEDATLLVMGLRLRRSSVQLARLRAPEGVAQQTLHLLSLWRRSLPSSVPKGPALARCLRRCGRPDLAVELLQREATVERRRVRNLETWENSGPGPCS